MISQHLWGSLFLTAGVGVLLYGVSLFFEKLGFVQRAGEATGRVVRRVPGPAAARWRPPCYYPVVLFVAGDRQVVFQSPETMRDLACRVGTELPVLYEEANPERARIAVHKWYDVFMTFYLGVLVSAAGLVLTTGLARMTP